VGTDPVVLPASGTYILRVRSVDDRRGSGDYRVSVKIAP